MNLYKFSSSTYYPRPGGGPLTQYLSRQPKKGDNMNPILWSRWKSYFKALGNTDLAIEKIVAQDVGPSKGLDPRSGMLKYLGLIWPGRNVVNVLGTVDGYGGKWGIIESVPTNTIPDVNRVNLIDTPHLVHTMYGYSKSTGYSVLKYSCRLPILSGGGYWYCPMGSLVSINSQLPKSIMFKSNMNVRAYPSVYSEIVGRVSYGTPAYIQELTVGKGGLWGRIESGWVAVRNNNNNMSNWDI